MELHIVIKGDKDLATQLYQQMKEAIISGQLAAGSKVPPSRLLAEQLGISRKTVSTAYEKLTNEKLLTTHIGIGTFVTEKVSRRNLSLQKKELAGGQVIKRWDNIEIPLRHPASQDRALYDYLGGCSTKNQFPIDEWRRCVLFALRQESETRGLYQQPEGVEILREAIAHHIAYSRGVKCTALDIVVTNGAQQALDIISRILLEPGNVVAVEEPGYPPARLLFESQGAKTVGIPIDDEGIIVDQIPNGTKLIYVTPSHQFPLGMPMSMPRRYALLKKAEAIGAIIIEDDYDSEFRYEGRPTDSLQSIDTSGIVAYVGTFSKVLFPELRLGYIVVPSSIRKAAITAKNLTDRHTPTMIQHAVAKFINDGYLLKHIRRCYSIYSSRREKIISRFNHDLAEWFQTIPSVAGFHLVALNTLDKQKIDMQLFLRKARQSDVGLYSLEKFYHFGEAANGLILGFGGIETLDIDTSLDIVKSILRKMR